MDKREVKIEYYTWKDSFPEEYLMLCEAAVGATERSYSIYSGFAVGAAVLLENGEIVSGSNQENAAYPSGMCAERTALYYAGASFPGVKVKAIAIAARQKGQLRDGITPPCGACRQVMAEVIKRYGADFDVVMIGKRESVQMKASALLPFSFDL